MFPKPKRESKKKSYFKSLTIFDKNKDLAKLDILFSKIIRKIGHCKNCGSSNNLQCAHIISRRYHAIRWDKKNAVCLCSNCHRHFTDNPLKWKAWVDINFGEGYYDQLRTDAMHQSIKTHDEVLEYLKNIYL